MKFLITGSQQTSIALRRIILFALIFLLAFLLAHGMKEFLASGFSPTALSRELGFSMENTSGSAPPPVVASVPLTPLMLLEDAHVDIFLFGLMSLFLASLLFHTRLKPGPRDLLVYFLFLAPALYVLWRPMALFLHSLVYVAAPLALIFYTGVVGIIFYIIYDLFIPANRE